MSAPEEIVAARLAGTRTDLDEVLEDLADFIGDYVAFPSEAALVAVTLWASHCHAVESFESTPRLVLVSPEKQTGKTRTLEVLELLVPEAMHAVNCTAPALFRAVAAGRPTLLFDEADTYFGTRSRHEHEELRGLVNAGHRKGAVAYRVVGEGASMTVRAFPAYAAVALAGLGELPDTILDRAVVVRMRRRAPDERVTPFRLRKAKPRAAALRERVAAWAARHSESLAEAEPEMPDGITDRPADVWEALLAVADAAGGAWPSRARAAAVELEAVRREATPSRGVQLLADVKAVFDPDQLDRLSSEELCRRLTALEEAPWGDLRGRAIDPRGLARRLRPYGIHPRTVRVGDQTPRGYLREDLVDAWARYLPPAPPESKTSATSATSATEKGPLTSDVVDVLDVADAGGGARNVADGGPQRPALALPIVPGSGLRGAEREALDLVKPELGAAEPPGEGVAYARQRINAGESNLFIIVRDTNARGFRQTDGRPWTAATLAAALGEDEATG